MSSACTSRSRKLRRKLLITALVPGQSSQPGGVAAGRGRTWSIGCAAVGIGLGSRMGKLTNHVADTHTHYNICIWLFTVYPLTHCIYISYTHAVFFICSFPPRMWMLLSGFHSNSKNIEHGLWLGVTFNQLHPGNHLVSRQIWGKLRETCGDREIRRFTTVGSEIEPGYRLQDCLKEAPTVWISVEKGYLYAYITICQG